MQNKPTIQEEKPINDPTFWLFIWLIGMWIIKEFYHGIPKIIGILIVFVPLIIIVNSLSKP